MDNAKVINAPDRIYLQIGDDFEPGDVDFEALTDVTWCADNIHGTDIAYVRADLIEQQAARIAELEAARIAYASEFPADAEGLPDVANIHANIRAMKTKLTAMEAEFEIPDYAMPPSDQEWERVGPAFAFHLIERHAENWAHAGQLMEAWADARLGAKAGEPVAYVYEHATYPGDYTRFVALERTDHSKDFVCRPLVYATPVDSAMAKDAERYRWWRNWVFRAGSDGLPTCTYLADVEEPVDIDMAIDAALAASEPKKTGE